MDTNGKGREWRGNVAGKQETAGKQEESRFNHRGPTEGNRGGAEKREGRGRQYSIFNKESSMFKVLAKMAYGNGRMRNVF